MGESVEFLSLVLVLITSLLFFIFEVGLTFNKWNSPSREIESGLLPPVVDKWNGFIEVCRIIFVFEILTLEGTRLATNNFEQDLLFNDCRLWLYLQAMLYFSISITSTLFFCIKLFAVNLCAYSSQPRNLLLASVFVMSNIVFQLFFLVNSVHLTPTDAEHCELHLFDGDESTTFFSLAQHLLCNLFLFSWAVKIYLILYNQAQAVWTFEYHRTILERIGYRHARAGFFHLTSLFVLLIVTGSRIPGGYVMTFWRMHNMITYVCFLTCDHELGCARSSSISESESKTTSDKSGNRALESSTLELKTQMEQFADANLNVHFHEENLFMYHKSYEDLMEESSTSDFSSSGEIGAIPLEVLYQVPKFRKVHKRLPTRRHLNRHAGGAVAESGEEETYDHSRFAALQDQAWPHETRFTIEDDDEPLENVSEPAGTPSLPETVTEKDETPTLLDRSANNSHSDLRE